MTYPVTERSHKRVQGECPTPGLSSVKFGPRCTQQHSEETPDHASLPLCIHPLASKLIERKGKTPVGVAIKAWLYHRGTSGQCRVLFAVGQASNGPSREDLVTFPCRCEVTPERSRCSVDGRTTQVPCAKVNEFTRATCKTYSRIILWRLCHGHSRLCLAHDCTLRSVFESPRIRRCLLFHTIVSIIESIDM